MKTRMIYQVEETRTRITGTARKMFMENGLNSVQMKDIAQAVGISRASLYRYYVDKFDLASDVLSELWKEIDTDWSRRQTAVLGEGTTGLEKLALYLRKFWLSPRYGMQLLFMAEFDAFYSGERIPEGFRERIQAIFGDETTFLLEKLIIYGMNDGSIRKDIDPHLVGITVLNAVRGLHQRISLRGKALVETEEKERPQMTDELVRLLADGLKAR